MCCRGFGVTFKSVANIDVITVLVFSFTAIAQEIMSS